MQKWRPRSKAQANKKFQIDSFRGQNTFGIQLQTFQKKCKKRKLQPETWPADEKNSIDLIMQLYSLGQ